MSDSNNILPELIEVSRDGGEFYAEAAESVRDSELSKLFKRIARAKSDLATELANEVDAKPSKTKPVAVRGKSAKAEGWVGELSAVYRSLRSGMPAMKQDHVSQIEETENLVLGRIQQVRHDKGNSYVVRVLAMQYETHARAMGEALRARKRRIVSAG
jgi:uncharacterized protein (TIGR02284 family)